MLHPTQFLFHKANPNTMGGVPHHTVETWAPEHVETSWAKAHPSDRNTYAGSDLDPGHRPLGSMSWHHKTGEIRGINVEPAHQRQGLATGMFHQAQQVAESTRGVTQPRHSADRTASGDAWAQSFGGRIPKRRSD